MQNQNAIAYRLGRIEALPVVINKKLDISASPIEVFIFFTSSAFLG